MKVSTHLAALIAAGSLSAFALAPALAAGDKGSSASNAQPAAAQQSGGQAMSGQSLSEDQIRSMQQALNDAGHDIQVDGKWGPNTQAALRQFQQANGLDATGMPNDETMAALDMDQDSGTAAGSSGMTGGSSGSGASGSSGSGASSGGNPSAQERPMGSGSSLPDTQTETAPAGSMKQ